MSETRIRIISALIIAPFVVACFVSYKSLVGLVSSIVLLASAELFFSTLMRYKRIGIVILYTSLVSIFPILYGLWFINRPVELLSSIFIIAMTLTLFTIKDKNKVMEFYGIFLIALVYISMNLSFFIPLYMKHGAAVALLTLTLSWAYDSFAYFFGISFGKHKLPSIYSPNKSYEGLIGGILGTIIYTIIYFMIINRFFDYNLPYWYSLVFGIITGIFDTFGDLFESSIKRAYDLKHMGNFMPGHGGMFDRIDGLLFVAPVIYIFLEFMSK
ncbi:phosphatidate cytidylyltransferase [Thermosipho atlanticus]|uniref:Phosphatidate cytidylyltransferase n=1 Tax=Thermosipho atlanticus DSM 15807 TaxID=1123380 RepID=A0A1M5QNX0_9BACT|nr:phosphatidate cytidylyltransferase [Thermosipho atlanticus]SHH15802.1 phosphatidate cytidylyltransferase [Thermosipho atlanticus DSM 15807]